MILDEILAQTRRDLLARRARVPLAQVEKLAAAAEPARSLAQAIRAADGMAAIAEFKRRSPSKGWIHREADVASVARAYESGGASAMSVLTDTPFFGGGLDDLGRARAAVGLPLLRKDFIVDAYQVAEARAAGADAVLLIVAALPDAELAGLRTEIERWGMEALVEAHDADEVGRAVAAGATLVGVNHRDLRTFAMNMDLAVAMRPLVPPDRLLVAESGIENADDVRHLRAGGIDAVLVGESLMRAPDPAAALRALLGRA
ncbi:MAG: indole-3-glycerol phosphate synthase TrpC [Deltaproteobacteria bacterium]|nr:indole-3-glycerol phosphate synthase TrpC [Deltaproteobacteria bacterium]